MGQDAIEDVAYRPPAGQEGEVEVHAVGDLPRRAVPGLFARPQRMGFHQLMLVEDGSARHMVDFAEHRLAPGTVLWVRPGQVQRWEDPALLEGTVLLFPVGLLDPDTARLTSADAPEGPHWWAAEDIDPARLAAFSTAVSDLASDSAMSHPLRRAALRQMLSALLIQLVSWHRGEENFAELPPAFRDFRRLVERRFADWHDVADYADALGWSPRTLARASRQARGVTPKKIIDERLLLEARRLLVQTDLPVHSIGGRIGFEDPSNFTAWFRRQAGHTPGEFRAGHGHTSRADR
ncbi:helix-turn-helix transcriptional regulator [Nesterenkonia suensis]